jgi:hypothetical protein
MSAISRCPEIDDRSRPSKENSLGRKTMAITAKLYDATHFDIGTRAVQIDVANFSLAR